MGLLNDSAEFRDKNVSKNIYGKNSQYTNGHPNTQSDGDVKGKDGIGDQVGSSVDIQARTSMTARNIYNKNKMYDRVEEKPL